MAWEVRNNLRVYYRSRRAGHQVHREYFSGVEAELAAAIDEKRHCDRQAERNDVRSIRQAWTDACQPLDELILAVKWLYRAVLLSAGCFPRNGGPVIPPSNEISVELLDVMQRAQRGDESVLPRLRQLLDAQPSVASKLGDLGIRSEEVWLSLIAGNDLFLAEAARRQLREFRSELAGPHPSALEKVMVDQAAACWLQVQYADMIYAQNLGDGLSIPVRRELERQRDNSRKRLLASLKQLAQTRRLLAPLAIKGQAPSGASAQTGSSSAFENLITFPRMSKAVEADALINGSGALN